MVTLWRSPVTGAAPSHWKPLPDFTDARDRTRPFKSGLFGKLPFQ
jgi:hypothetical protein